MRKHLRGDKRTIQPLMELRADGMVIGRSAIDWRRHFRVARIDDKQVGSGTKRPVVELAGPYSIPKAGPVVLRRGWKGILDIRTGKYVSLFARAANLCRLQLPDYVHNSQQRNVAAMSERYDLQRPSGGP